MFESQPINPQPIFSAGLDLSPPDLLEDKYMYEIDDRLVNTTEIKDITTSDTCPISKFKTT